MVSTRNHPSQFPPPEAATPVKSPSKTPGKASSPNTAVARRTTKSAVWSHTPSNLTLLWLTISLPLVIWDTGYLLLRPHSMPGGSLHWPWQPYKLYGSVDYVYGFPAWEAKDGFGAAQASMNVVECILYFVYLAIVYSEGVPSKIPGKGAPSPSFIGALGQARILSGRAAALAVTVAFTSFVMTLSKTVLYFLNDYWSGFRHSGHNDTFTLIFLYIIPNGAWILVPTYMCYVFGSEVIDGLESAATGSKKSQ